MDWGILFNAELSFKIWSIDATQVCRFRVTDGDKNVKDWLQLQNPQVNRLLYI